MSRTAKFLASRRKEYQPLGEAELLIGPDQIRLECKLFRHSFSVFASCDALNLVASTHDEEKVPDANQTALARLALLIETKLSGHLRRNDFSNLMAPGHENEIIANQLSAYARISEFSAYISAHHTSASDRNEEDARKGEIVDIVKLKRTNVRTSVSETSEIPAYRYALH